MSATVGRTEPVVMALRAAATDGARVLADKIIAAVQPALWPEGEQAAANVVMLEATLISTSLLLACYADQSCTATLLRHGSLYLRRLAELVEQIEDHMPKPAPRMEARP